MSYLTDLKHLLRKTRPKCRGCGKDFPGIDGYCNICREAFHHKRDITIKISKDGKEE